jgi:hypothetical protein
MRLLLLLLVAACTEHGQTPDPFDPDPPDPPPGTSITWSITGQLTQIDDSDGLVDAAVGDSFTGTVTFQSGAVDTGEGAFDSAIYRFASAPSGISITVNGAVFDTDPTAIDLLINVVDRSGADGIVFRSFTNRCTACPRVDHISWQLDDETGTALTDVELPIDAPNVAGFTQPFGMTITGSNTAMTVGFLVRGEVATVTRQ